MKPTQKAYEIYNYSPLVLLESISNKKKGVYVYAKLEYYSPTGSIKDRIIRHFFERTRNTGILSGIETIVEASSGNTASSLAFFAGQNGYKSVLFVPEKTSIEKVNLAKFYGGHVIRVSKKEPYKGVSNYMDAAKIYSKEQKDRYFLNQYDSSWNTEAHQNGIGQELAIHFKEGKLYFISVASTGGTISGIGRRLKQENPNTKIILADPPSSYLSKAFKYAKTGSRTIHTQELKSAIEGAGKERATNNIDFNIIDQVIEFKDKDAFFMVRHLLKDEGLFVGGTSGANAFIAKKIADKIDGPANIVTVFPDSGERYISKFSDPKWVNSL